MAARRVKRAGLAVEREGQAVGGRVRRGTVQLEAASSVATGMAAWRVGPRAG